MLAHDLGKLLESRTIWERWGQWYASERRVRHFTQTQVAKATGMERTHISDIETGKSGTKRETITALALAIGIDVKEALSRAGFSIPEEIRGVSITPQSVETLDSSGNIVNVPMSAEEFHIYQRMAPLIQEIMGITKAKKNEEDLEEGESKSE